ncbi:hypothetical protein GCM10008929_10570 [Alkalibacterium psychrotolerans]
MKKKIIPGFLFLLGLLFFLYPYIAHYVNDYAMQQEIEQFQTVSAQPVNEEEKKQLYNDMMEYNRSLVQNSQNTIEDAFTEDVLASNAFYQYEDEDEIATDEINELDTDGKDIGGDAYTVESASSSGSQLSSFGTSFYFYIRIPKINIELPIYVGASDDNLMKGAAVVSGSSLPLGSNGSHSVIAAHRGTLHHRMFLDLDRLNTGDLFEIHTMDGMMVYRVTGSKVVYPNEVDTLTIRQDKDLVTLVTCLKYPMNDRRLLVYGERVE